MLNKIFFVFDEYKYKIVSFFSGIGTFNIKHFEFSIMRSYFRVTTVFSIGQGTLFLFPCVSIAILTDNSFQIAINFLRLAANITISKD